MLTSPLKLNTFLKSLKADNPNKATLEQIKVPTHDELFIYLVFNFIRGPNVYS